MKAYERLIKYASFETGSDGRSLAIPSSASQIEFGKALTEELKKYGVSDAYIDKSGVVYGTINENTPYTATIGFIAHMDTVGDVEYKNVKPRLIENYDGGDIALANGDVITVSESPSLTFHKGKTIVVTDGNTILGADDKAGIAEIMTFAERLHTNPGIKHGRIKIAFTPDEEIGRGADFFDVKSFGADYAYTLDGGQFGEVEYENFNASSAFVQFSGKNIHTGTAKGVMINASNLAMEFDSLIPKAQRPENTEGYEGFYHVTEMKGSVESSELTYILRDHDLSKLNEKKQTLEKAKEFMNFKYGNRVALEIEDTYSNMSEVIEKNFHLIENAFSAVKKAGGEPVSLPIRGGTDGARLSFMGLPAPNLGTGSGNHHSKFEYAIAEDMEKAVDMLEYIVQSYLK